MSNQKLKEILDAATEKGRTIPPEKALLLADLADGLELSAESIVRLTSEQSHEPDAQSRAGYAGRSPAVKNIVP